MIIDLILDRYGYNGDNSGVLYRAHDFIATENGLRMTLAKNKSYANRLEIVLNKYDLYNVKFIRFSPFRYDCKTNKFIDEKTEIIKEINSVYFSDLQEIFERTTGMYTHL